MGEGEIKWKEKTLKQNGLVNKLFYPGMKPPNAWRVGFWAGSYLVLVGCIWKCPIQIELFHMRCWTRRTPNAYRRAERT
jgi:hypothetical protein